MAVLDKILDVVAKEIQTLYPNRNIMIHDGKWEFVESKKDVSEYIIALTEDNQVGIFNGVRYLNYSSEGNYDLGMVYYGINCYGIAAFSEHQGIFSTNTWLSTGESVLINSRNIPVTCQIRIICNFEDLRMLIYSGKKIPDFEKGRATEDEIELVFQYVKNKFANDPDYIKKLK